MFRWPLHSHYYHKFTCQFLILRLIQAIRGEKTERPSIEKVLPKKSNEKASFYRLALHLNELCNFIALESLQIVTNRLFVET